MFFSKMLKIVLRNGKLRVNEKQQKNTYENIILDLITPKYKTQNMKFDRYSNKFNELFKR